MFQTMRKNRKRWMLAILAVCVVAVASGCGDEKSSNDSQKRSQQVVEDYQLAAETAVPYPLALMKKGGWLERTLLRENLLRQNNRDRLAYVTLLTAQGQPIIQYTVQGMVFSLNSQMTTEDRVKDYCGSGCTEHEVTKSPGDNGTWGPEPDGISFFTTEGVQIKWNGLYLESDSPQNIVTKPLIIYDATNAKPSVSAGGVIDVKKGGIKVVP